MWGHNDQPERTGRPVSGIEAKSVTIKFRIEPVLRDELIYACRKVGIPMAEGIRRGIMLFIKEAQKYYYR